MSGVSMESLACVVECLERLESLTCDGMPGMSGKPDVWWNAWGVYEKPGVLWSVRKFWCVWWNSWSFWKVWCRCVVEFLECRESLVCVMEFLQCLEILVCMVEFLDYLALFS